MLQTKYNFLNAEWLWILIVAVVTTLLGEIKLLPFSSTENFRFALGSIVFLLFLLVRPVKSVIFVGVLTGIVTILFRMGLELINHGFSSEVLINNYPAFFYYVVFACAFQFFNLRMYSNQPLLLGVFASIIEFISNSAEHVLRFLLIPDISLSFFDFVLVACVAIFRSFFVIGIYSTVILSEQRKHLQEQLTMGSDLYVEALYLQKSMNHIEQIMAESYELYRELKKNENRKLGLKALHIAQEIHEVKKDSQRIFSSISEMTMHKTEEYYSLSDVMNLVQVANEKYGAMLGRNIMFHVEQCVDFYTNQHIPLLAILNNIVANGIEALEGQGTIDLKVFEKNDNVYFIIQDDGKGIPPEDLDIIFEPGFTTKYNEQGVAATGIGLSHVQEVIQTLNGHIKVELPEKGTIFIVDIPMQMILQKGEK
ncbi:MAG TPA: GHKL domain-containing protein [Candidatus Kurthia intestinigallinarum]|nr:GHKL domain-containing protein [Candidatus Kurthia intestinigallinarum]